MADQESTEPAIDEELTDASPTDQPPEDIDRILHIEVPIIVRLAAKSVQMQEILELTPGTIIEFEKSVDEELDLMINNKCIGGGVAVKVGENFGIRVTEIGSMSEKIKALGT